ncbi:MAG TPA: hypothetical protein VFV33_14050 [Gemmatimonadaceae bacterium]|nr:hypothetical protein [Gemmatimonadaceae bacterium]
MIETLTTLGPDPSAEEALLDTLHAHVSRVLDSAAQGDRGLVREVESVVRADTARAITFDGRGYASLHALGRSWKAGRFEIPMIWALRKRAAAHPREGKARLFVLYGERPPTDIGALQAFAPAKTLFQAASQFNCLEAPGAHVVPVASYLHDPTQGPRASVSAFPGTFVRHYAAPSTDGRRFTQEEGGEQVDLLMDVCTPEIAEVRSGYLRDAYVHDLEAFTESLEQRFDAIRVGVHDGVEVALGYNWDGGVDAPPPVIAQVFTSTLAAGGYSRLAGNTTAYHVVCRYLLRAAYLGTLLAARALGKDRVVLTLIGGGVFGNPVPLIWESILWAFGELEGTAPGALDVIVNGRNLGHEISPDVLASACRERGGVSVEMSRERVAIHR